MAREAENHTQSMRNDVVSTMVEPYVTVGRNSVVIIEHKALLRFTMLL